MVFIQKQSEELFWLERRIEWIKRLNSLLEADADVDETIAVASQFKKVESPNDLVNRLRDVYGNDLGSGPIKIPFSSNM